MAIVTGDRYLEQLVRFVDRNADRLLEGTLTLKLNPAGLHYVHTRLEALRELEGLLAGAPVDYLRAYVSDLGDHRALEQLRRILRLLTSLKVISVLPSPDRDPTPLSLVPFGRLRVLELRGCDLSKTEARGLLKLRHSLEKLICHNSTDALRHVFSSRIVDIKNSPVWDRLSYVSCGFNGLVLMDESLQLLPVVEALDLSRNKFAKIDNLKKCLKLHHLDLGFNHLRSISSLSEASCSIVQLVLRNNALTALHGIENLKLIEGLDLSYNIISNFSELEVLSSLPSLKSLWLEGNPICCARWYRAHVFSFFRQPEKLKLDENKISTREYWERQAILARRQKRPGGYGFYFPAKEDDEGGGSDNKKKRIHSRLACIDEEQRKLFGADDQESVSCDSENLKKDENMISDNEAEIIDLINRVEAMKKEQSVLWLRDFSEWLGKAHEESLDGNKSDILNLDYAKDTKKRQMKGSRHFAESSVHSVNSAHISKVQNSTNGSTKDGTTHGKGHTNSDIKITTESSLAIHRHALKTDSLLGFASSRQCEVDASSKKTPTLSPLNLGQSSLSDMSGSESRDHETEMQSVLLTPFEEIMYSRSSSVSLRSPPHYKDDLLHRRQNLEDEFLQLSADSCSLASSDSDMSCSDDGSCMLSASFSGLDILGGALANKSISDNSFVTKETNHDERQTDPNTQEPCHSLSAGCSERVFCETEIPIHGNGIFLPTNYGIDNTVDQVVNGDDRRLGSRKGNRKAKKRIIRLSREDQVDDQDSPLHKSNGTLEDEASPLTTECELSN